MAAQSRRAGEITPSVTMELTNLVVKLKSEGRDIIDLVGGEPDYHTADAVKEAAIRAIRDNVTRYPPGDGLRALRQAVSARLSTDSGLSVQPDQVLISCGTKPLINAALLALADPGDEVIIPSPHWISYPEIARLAGLTPVPLPCRPEHGFRLSAEQLRAALTPRTRAFVLNSPNNPTGAVYTRAQLEALAEVLRSRPDVWIVTDDIYDAIVYAPEPPVTFAALGADLAERTITINGFSKGYAMAGWRLGFAVGPRAAIKAMTAIVNHITGPTSGITQFAGVEALLGDRSYIAEHNEEYRQRRDIAVQAINQMPGLSCQNPDGAFFVWGDCSGVLGKRTREGRMLRSDGDFVSAAAGAGVMFMPGSAFGMSPYFRISYSVAPEALREAMRRLAQFANSLEGPG